MVGIYCITNIKDNKKYIGQSIHVKDRILAHKGLLRRGKHYNCHLQNAFDKYGKESFIFELLEETTKEELNDKEMFYIDKFNTANPNFGYNLTEGGEGGGTMSIESRIKLSNTKRMKHSKLSESDIRRIKLLIYNLMDRKEIAKIFNTSKSQIDEIARGGIFKYINPELNPLMYQMKKKLIQERNEKILKLYDSGMRICEIVSSEGYTSSVVEKVVYENRNTKQIAYEERLKKYDEVMRLKEQGLRECEIIKIVKLPSSTVNGYLRGVSNPYNYNQKITSKIKNKIIDMYFKKNNTIDEISKELNVSDTTVRFYINKYANTEMN